MKTPSTSQIGERRDIGGNFACTNADNADGITYRYKVPPSDLKTSFFMAAKLNLLLDPLDPPIIPMEKVIPTENDSPLFPLYKECTGMVNSQGLLPLGYFAIREMMRRGMLIDIDHMSEKSRTMALDIADSVLPGYYPLNSGHSGLRCFNGLGCNERSLTAAEYGRIGKFHGMAGIGSANMKAFQWTQMYLAVIQAMGSGGVAGFGTDTNGFAVGMPSSTTHHAFFNTQAYITCVNEPEQCRAGSPAERPACERAHLAKQAYCTQQYPPVWRCTENCDHPLPPVEYNAAFPPSVTIGQSGMATKSWDYNTEGVAHYGMLPDFLRAVRSVPGGATMIDNNLMHGAQYFFETWRLSEEQSKKVPTN